MIRLSRAGSRAAKPRALFLVAAFAFAAAGCKEKVTQAECDQIVDHFAELVVKERLPDAGPEIFAAERARERSEAKSADEFRNCTSQVQKKEHDCAIKAETSDAVIKCLE